MAGRTYNKLDTFLKRQLDADTYERLRHRDACIICSKKEDKAFKFIILSDEWLYLTENPPVTISKAVHLNDILSVKLIDKKPDFLQGQERENCQQIRIVHQVALAEARPAPTSRPSSARSLRSSRSALLTSRSDTALLTLEKRSSARVGWKARNGERNETAAVRMSAETQSLNEYSTEAGRKKGKGKKGGVQMYIPEESQSQQDLNQFNDLDIERKATGVKRFFACFDSQADPDLIHTTPVYSGGDIVFVEEEVEAPMKVETREEQVMDVYIMDGWSPFLRLVKAAIQNHTILSLAVFDVVPTSASLCTRDDIARVISLVSRVLVYKHFAIYADSTLSQDPLVSARRNKGSNENGTSKTAASQTSERYERLYSQLKFELLNPDNAMGENFYLVRELKAAAEKLFFLKKLFWKASELFDFLLDQLVFYVPVSHSQPLDLDLSERAKRADELEYAILICETLQVMLRGTEVLAHRAKVLGGGGLSKLRLLISAITTLPDIPGHYDNQFFQLMARQTRSQNSARQTGEESRQAPFLKQVEVLTSINVALLFEIFIMANQAYDDYADFTPEWCTMCMEHRDETGDFECGPFLTLITVRLLNLFVPCSDNLGPLSASKHVHLYFTLTVLAQLARSSTPLLKFIKGRFFEEFKYYVSPVLVRKRLCPEYQLHHKLVGLFTELVSTILDKKVVFD